MSEPSFSVRRATVDDLQPLMNIWDKAGLPAMELEKRITDFQVVVDGEGRLMGSLGIRVSDKDGLLHGEAYFNPDILAELRPKLWERVLAVAKNHGLFRLWTQEDELFWHRQGFKPVDEETQKQLPKAFHRMGRPWRVFRLRESGFENKMIEKEFELFRLGQAEDARRADKTAMMLKLGAWVVAIIFAVVVIMMMVDVVKNSDTITNAIRNPSVISNAVNQPKK